MTRGARGLNRDASFGPAGPDDLPDLVSIEAGSPRPWTHESFVEELRRHPPALFVLRSQGEAVGFVAARFAVPEMDIVNLAVAPRRRRLGLGRELLRALLEHARRLGVRTAFLEVREGNLAARGLYESAGFLQIQRRRGFYRDPPEDALLLRLEMSRFAG